MKEEGEITDDEDDAVADVTAIPLTDRKPPLREFNRKRKRSGDPARHSASRRYVKHRSCKAKKFRASSSANARSTAIKKPSTSAVKNSVPVTETRRITRTSTPPAIPTFTDSRTPVTHSRSASPSLRVDENTGNDRKSEKRSSGVPSSQLSSVDNVIDSSDSEVIIINDSEAEGSDDGLILDEDDLDELQLRREAVMSLLGAEQLLRSDYVILSSSGDERSSADTERDSVPLNTEANQDEIDNVGISMVVVPASTSSELACTSEDCADTQSVLSSRGLLTTAAVTDTTCVNPVPVQNPTLSNDLDNYDEVEMDLDSASDSETHILSSSQQIPQPLEPILDAADQSFVHIPSTSASSQASLDSSAVTAHSQSVSGLSNSAITQSFPTPTDSNNAAISEFSKATVYDSNVTASLHTKTEIVYPDSSQIHRKVKDADEKSELLLRAEVLRSLSSKRHQQQQQLSHSDTASSIPWERLQAIKRTITPTSPAGNQSQLPVHQPVVISLNAESSDSDDTDKPEITASSTHSSIAASDLSTNVDRVLREIRKAHDTAQSQFEAVSPVKYLGKHSVSETVLANQYMPSNDVVSLSSSSHSETTSTKVPVTSCSAGMGGASTKSDATETSLQKLLLSSLAREKRKLQQQKIALNKAKLKMARKKEQVDVADKRAKKLQEQLQAAEKIAISSKKQLHSLQEETLTLSSAIEQHQNAVRRLELRLNVAQKIPTFSADESGSDSENFQQSEILFSNQEASCKSGANTAERTTDSSHVPSLIHHQVSVSSTMAPSVSAPPLRTNETSQSTFGNKLYSTQQTQAQYSAETQGLHSLKRLRHPNVIGAPKSESDVSSAKAKFVKREPSSVTTHKEVGSNHDTEQHIKSLFPDIGKEHSVSHGTTPNVCTDIKPSISVVESDVPFVQKTGSAPNDGVAMAPDKTKTSEISSELRIPSDKKINQILNHYNNSLDRNLASNSAAAISRLFVSDPVFSFQFPVNSALPDATTFLTVSSKSDTFDVGYPFKPYHSSLICFRSYMFSDFFQQKGLSLSSETFAHKLDCHLPLCQFDLMGKCLDEGCSLQHRSDYTLTNKEQLLDIVSYSPPVANADSSTLESKCEELANEYVEKFCKDTGSQLSHSERCCCLIRRVKKAAGLAPPYAVCTSARCWKLRGSKQHVGAGDKKELLFSLDDVSEIPESVAGGSLAAEDIRYWMAAESDQICNLEHAVTTTPHDESSWIKLAYAKMTEIRWSASHDECISYGLNVLARAVEASPSSSNLWTHYLDLYTSRSHAEKDVSSLYEQAVQYAPSYEFFWKYLQLPVSYSQKMDICKRLRQFLCSPRCLDGADERSHHLLETVLYQAALCTISGRFKDGLQVIQAIVQSKASVIWLTLTSCDRVIMWLLFIHLYECRQLPKTLFDPSDGNPGPIVKKEPFVVPFQIGKKTRISYETLLQLFGCAFSACDKDIKLLASDSHCEYLDWLSALHRSRILLELSYHSWAGAKQLSEQFLQQRPYLLDVWFLLLQLMLLSTDSATDRQTLTRNVSDTIEKALASNPHSVPMYLAGICALIERGETEGALIIAERCPISLFEVDDLDSSTVDPNLLFCCLLRQPLPPNYKGPALHPSVSQQYVTEQQANLWLSYCLLLDLQGAHEQASETYHTALGCLTKTKDIQRLLIACLRRTAVILSGNWLTPVGSDRSKVTSPELQRNLWQQFESDVNRALFSLPVRQSLPYSSQTWDDYLSHNEIIRLHLSCLSDGDQVQELYEKYLIRMPANVDLVLDCVNSLLDRDEAELARGQCLVALHSCPRSAKLWNVVLKLCQQTSVAGLTRALHAKSTKVLPFSASLWKLHIMFEVISKSKGRVQEVVESCRRLQVNVDGFVDSLLK